MARERSPLAVEEKLKKTWKKIDSTLVIDSTGFYKYFTSNSFIMLYPQQLDRGIKMDDVPYVDSSLVETVSKVGFFGRFLGKRK